MSGDKDFLGDCMDSVDGDASVKEFQMVFCRRCFNQECTHSGMNKTQWQARMDRQEDALLNPDRLDPNRPDVQPIAHQNFEDARNLQQDAWSMPVEDDGRKRVHKSDPPTKTQSADKVDESAKALAGDDEKKTEDEGSDEKPEPAKESPESEDTHPEKEDRTNTDVPDEGIMLDGQPKESKPKRRPRKNEDWSHPDYDTTDGGGLTVNINDGKEVPDDE